MVTLAVHTVDFVGMVYVLLSRCWIIYAVGSKSHFEETSPIVFQNFEELILKNIC